MFIICNAIELLEQKKIRLKFEFARFKNVTSCVKALERTDSMQDC